MKHVFLTGQIQVGKSFALKRALDMLGRPPLGGFRSVSLPSTEIPLARFELYIAPGASVYGGPEAIPQDRDHLLAIRWGDNLYTAFPAAFTSGGLPLLQDVPQKAQLLLMDEVGVFEARSPQFSQAILERLEGDLPILGVVKAKRSPLLDAVRSHPRSEILEVDLHNREEIPGRIVNILA